MNIQAKELELMENIQFLDTDQKSVLLKFIKEQLIKKHRFALKKEALRDIRTALNT